MNGYKENLPEVVEKESHLHVVLGDDANSVLPERGSEAGAGARSGCAEACFSKNGRKRSVVGSVYIYIYIFKRKHVECQTRCKIYETCMFVILPNLD